MEKEIDLSEKIFKSIRILERELSMIQELKETPIDKLHKKVLFNNWLSVSLSYIDVDSILESAERKIESKIKTLKSKIN